MSLDKWCDQHLKNLKTNSIIQLLYKTRTKHSTEMPKWEIDRIANTINIPSTIGLHRNTWVQFVQKQGIMLQIYFCFSRMPFHFLGPRLGEEIQIMVLRNCSPHKPCIVGAYS